MSMKESKKDQGAASYSLTDSPHIGGKKMSSSLKDKLKRMKMTSNPLLRRNSTAAVSAGLLVTPSPEFSEEDIENAINEPEPDTPNVHLGSSNVHDVLNFSFHEHDSKNEDKMKSLNKNDVSSSEEYNQVIMNRSDANHNEDGCSDENIEIPGCVTEDFKKLDSDVDENASNLQAKNLIGIDNNLLKSIVKTEKNVLQKTPYDGLMNKIIEVTNISSDEEIDNKDDQFLGESTKYESNTNYNTYPKEVIENTQDRSLLFGIFYDLQRKAAENKEELRALKLVQQQKKKNTPEGLKILKERWLKIAQVCLRKMYEYVPPGEKICFADFLSLIRVDFDLVKYNPENDTFE